MSVPRESDGNLATRLWAYQAERFPLAGHGLLIAAFSGSAVSYACALRADGSWPLPASLLIAFVGCFICFFQLRVADEFKDRDEDARWRPYRPVPRGLVTLRELATIAGLGALVQLAAAATLSWRLALLLVLVWSYLALMTKEFFVREWILRRPLTYLWTHMLVIPLADFFATACDWTRWSTQPPSGLFWFLATSFCNGIALELGRKIRAPQSEEPGVRTYSALWGSARAATAWWSALLFTAVCAVTAAGRVGCGLWLALIFGGVLLLAGGLALRFRRHPTPSVAQWIDRCSGLGTLIMYLSLGVGPLLRRLIQSSP